MWKFSSDVGEAGSAARCSRLCPEAGTVGTAEKKKNMARAETTMAFMGLIVVMQSLETEPGSRESTLVYGWIARHNLGA